MELQEFAEQENKELYEPAEKTKQEVMKQSVPGIAIQPKAADVSQANFAQDDFQFY